MNTEIKTPDQLSAQNEMQTPAALAETYDIPRKTVLDWIKSGKLPSTSRGQGGGKRYLVELSEFEKFVFSPAAGKHERNYNDIMEDLQEKGMDALKESMTHSAPLNHPGNDETQEDDSLLALTSPCEANNAPSPTEGVSPEPPIKKEAPEIAVDRDDLPAEPERDTVPLEATIKIDSIRDEPNLQMRTRLDLKVVQEYATAIEDGATFPPVDVFECEGPKGYYYLADGFHRVAAAKAAGQTEVHARIHPRGFSESMSFALSANSEHGLRRSSADKREAIKVALKVFPELSNVGIAQLCSVSESSVRNYRESSDGMGKRLGRDGKLQAAQKKPVSAYKRAKSAITRTRCTQLDAIKLIAWLQQHYKLNMDASFTNKST